MTATTFKPLAAAYPATISTAIPAAIQRSARLLSPVPALDVCLPEAAGRHEVTRYIAGCFHAAHAAHIHDFMPLLLSMRCQGAFSAVAGARPAANNGLFLEQYLQQPVEQILSQVAGATVERRRIIEIGNLVATQKGASQLLFLLLTVLLHRSDYEWVVFTGTPTVVKGLNKLGFKLDHLAAASPDFLTPEQLAEWGSYYDNQPQVVAGHIPAAVKVLASHKLYTGLLAVLEPQIRQLQPLFGQLDLPYGTHAFAA